MSDINPASKTLTPSPAPYNCPHCDRPAGVIQWSLNRSVGLIVFYHGGEEGCNKVISCQLIPPQEPAKQIAVPKVRLT